MGRAMTYERSVLIAKILGVLWPVLSLLMSTCMLILVRDYVFLAAYKQIREPLLWLNGIVSIAGSVVAGVYTSEDGRRGKAAIVFALWAGVLTYLLSNFYMLHFLSERQ
jgi:hypothetical protein